MTNSRKNIIVALLIAHISITVYACSTPVFLYALDRWPPAPYRAVIVKDGALTAKEQSALTTLKSAAEFNGGNLNIIIRQFNSAKLIQSSFATAITNINRPVKNARLYIFYPAVMDLKNHLWSSPLDTKNVNKIINSPFRKKLAEELLRGNAGVFVIVESNNTASNKITELFLEKNLRLLEKEAELSAQNPLKQDDLAKGTAIPVKITYKIIKISQKGADDVIVSSFMKIDPELQKIKNETMVFAVYGQGRALPPMIGNSITKENIQHISTFLSGACSCEVKDMNPGFDLLMNVDWRNRM